MSERSIIVLVEDDPNIADLVDLYLTNEGHRVYQATAGARALEVCSLRKPDLVILDIGLAGEMDGFDVCRSLRTDSNVPIIMLTARDDEIDRVVGFELGADDYVVKPFSPRELMGRVHAILRRSGTSVADNTQLMTIGSLQIDGQRCEALLDGQPVSLAAQEWALLWFFCTKPWLGPYPSPAFRRWVGLRLGRRHPHRRRSCAPTTPQTRRCSAGKNGTRHRLPVRLMQRRLVVTLVGVVVVGLF